MRFQGLQWACIARCNPPPALPGAWGRKPGTEQARQAMNYDWQSEQPNPITGRRDYAMSGMYRDFGRPDVERLARAICAECGMDADALVPETGYPNAARIPTWWRYQFQAASHIAMAKEYAAMTKLPDIELVSAKVHEAWMAGKRANGIMTRLSESGEELMQPYDQLSEAAKDLDRGTVRAVYAAIEAAG